MGQLHATLKRKGIPLEELRYAMATHYHIDHAGLAQNLKDQGVRLLVVDVQVHAIPLMKKFAKPRDQYVEITLFDNVTIRCSESRDLLEDLGIEGEILHTPGHSYDSVALLLDDGSVFTGDLTHPAMIGDEDPDVVHASWRLLRDKGAAMVYPGHGPIRSIIDGWIT
jgi:glyoxylase-like metal-dependent hydrolase (beta-lactamase superfamily II)